ncbi:hypothetical protein ERJ75_001775000 [Trypanosoma vivax]|nr:hypothetical protein ERJ75_001775000 [Trypanosoma vivax]
MWSKRQEDQEAVTVLERTERRQGDAEATKAVADDLAKMAESYAMQAIYGSKQGDGQQCGRRSATNGYSRCCAARRPHKGFDADGNEAGLILPMILLCNDGKVAARKLRHERRHHVPMQHRSRAASGRQTQMPKQGVERAESNERYQHGLRQDLIAGNWLISKHICENRTTHVRSLGTAADLAGQLEAAAHAIVHAMKPSGQAEGYSQQKMCLGQVVSSKACDGDTSSSAYACACFDKAAAANRGQGIKFVNHLSPPRTHSADCRDCATT